MSGFNTKSGGSGIAAKPCNRLHADEWQKREILTVGKLEKSKHTATFGVVKLFNRVERKWMTLIVPLGPEIKRRIDRMTLKRGIITTVLPGRQGEARLV